MKLAIRFLDCTPSDGVAVASLFDLLFTGGGIWYQYQSGGGDLEEQDQGPVPQP